MRKERQGGEECMVDYSVWRAATGGRGRVVWPRELREAVR